MSAERLQSFNGQVFVDPGVWVASLGSALEFDVQRTTYRQPVTVMQVIHLPGGARRVRALPRSVLDGTMGFDGAPGHGHWHFRQFARYQLLNSGRAVAVSSHKVRFCIAPTDNVDMLIPGAGWQPSSIGLGGVCGSPTALWVQEYMPVGWGDTHFQSLPGQSFDITHVPNGTYYTEVVANPLRVPRESNTSNDVSLRRVILGGRPVHRTVRVPAWHGIDPEGGGTGGPVPVPVPAPVPTG